MDTLPGPSSSPAPIYVLGEVLRNELDRRGWGAEDLARLTRLPLFCIHAALGSSSVIDALTAEMISLALDVAPEVFIDLADEEERAREGKDNTAGASDDV